jgi:hypothetical protein
MEGMTALAIRRWRKRIDVKLDWLERACPLCGSMGGARVFAESNLDLSGLDEA